MNVSQMLMHSEIYFAVYYLLIYSPIDFFSVIFVFLAMCQNDMIFFNGILTV